MDELIQETNSSSQSRGGSMLTISRNNTFTNQESDGVKEQYERVEGSHLLNEYIAMYEHLESQSKASIDQLCKDKNESYRLAGIPQDRLASLS